MLRQKGLLLVLVAAIVGLICIGQAISQQTGDQGNQGRQGRQARQGFDPAQMQKAMMDRMKQNLGATDEDWKALEPLVQKVMTLSREARGGGMGMMGRMGRGGRGGNAPDAAAPAAQTDTEKAAQALSKVLENKEAKADDIKTALQALRDARAKAKAELEKAQKDLRVALTARQEAQLVLQGTLE